MKWMYHRLSFPTRGDWEALRAEFTGVGISYEGPRVFDGVAMPEWCVNVECNGVPLPEAWQPFEINPKIKKILWAGEENGEA